MAKIDNTMTVINQGMEVPFWYKYAEAPKIYNVTITPPTDFDWVFDLREYRRINGFYYSVTLIGTQPSHITFKISENLVYLVWLVDLQGGTKFSNCRITILGTTKNVTTFNALVRFPGYVYTIDGTPIDFSSATSISEFLQGFFNNTFSIRFEPNTLGISVIANGTFTGNNMGNRFPCLDKESFISFCNCLKEGLSDKTVSFASNHLSIAFSTLGTVSLDQTSTFHIFTEEASGTTSLEEFITVTKGWSIT